MPDSRSRPLRHAALALAVAALAACGSAGASDDQPSGTIGGVGVLPDQSATSVVLGTSAPDETVTGSAVAAEAPTASVGASAAAAPIGARVTGNKLLMVGDSIFAGAASRYGNEACDTLVPLDWQVDVEAESGRAIDFGERVVRQMVPQGWDVIVFFLGTNYGGNEVGYREYLVKALDEIGPDTPVILLTTTVYASKQEEVNTIIREEAASRPNISVLEWATMSEAPGMLSGDGYHPTNEGRQTMMDAIAQLVGTAPVAPGTCLQSRNRSDVPNTPGAPTSAPKGSGSGSSGSTRTTTTTRAPATNPPANTTVPATSPPTRPPASTSEATPAPTPPPTTQPAATSQATPAPTPAPTIPPTTQPPVTQPPLPPEPEGP